MAAMLTALTDYLNNGNSRTFTVSGHTASSPKLVIQKRKAAPKAGAAQEVSVKVVYATTDSVTSEPLQTMIASEHIFRFAPESVSADVAAVLATSLDILGSDEFAAIINTHGWLPHATS